MRVSVSNFLPPPLTCIFYLCFDFIDLFSISCYFVTFLLFLFLINHNYAWVCSLTFSKCTFNFLLNLYNRWSYLLVVDMQLLKFVLKFIPSTCHSTEALSQLLYVSFILLNSFQYFDSLLLKARINHNLFAFSQVLNIFLSFSLPFLQLLKLYSESSDFLQRLLSLLCWLWNLTSGILNKVSEFLLLNLRFTNLLLKTWKSVWF